MSKLAQIKARLEAAGRDKWIKHRLARLICGRVDYSVAPSPQVRTHFSKDAAEFIVCSREDMAKLLAVTKATLGTRTIAEMLNDIEESLACDDGYHTSDELAVWRALI